MKNHNSSSSQTNDKDIIEFIATCLDICIQHQVLHAIESIDMVHTISKIPHTNLAQKFANAPSIAGEEHEKVFRFP